MKPLNPARSMSQAKFSVVRQLMEAMGREGENTVVRFNEPVWITHRGIMGGSVDHFDALCVIRDLVNEVEGLHDYIERNRLR